MSAYFRLAIAAALGVTVVACFDAPRAAVQFSCDPDAAPECPPDYACEADGCCHLIGSDYDAHEGECQLGGALPTGAPGSGTASDSGITTDAASGTASESGTETGSTGSGSSGGSTAGSSGEQNSSGSDSTAGSSG